MFFQRKKKTLKKLDSTFGEIKSEGFNFDHIKRYHENKDNSKAFQILSDQTCNDLDFDLFFCYADRTSSKIGQQYLYNHLRTIDYSENIFKEQEAIIDHLNKTPNDRLKVQYQLNKLNNSPANYVVDLFQKEIEKKPKWYFIIPILTLTVVLFIIISFFNSSFLLIPLCLIPVNAFIHYGLKRRTNVFINAVPSLLSMGNIARNILKYDFIKDSSPDMTESIKTIGIIQRKMSFFRLEQKMDSDLEAAYWFFIELLKITFLLEPLLLFSSLKTIRSKTKEIKDVYEFIGRIDSIISINSLRSGSEQFCIPTIGAKIKHVSFEKIKHPLINDCIPNSINAKKSILLTGSNMSGKTTFIRSIGLNYISGITMNTCFAEQAELPITKLFSVIRIEDDLMSSSSYFFKEVDEMKKIMVETENEISSIILLDELFKGTNTIERISSAKAILSNLAKTDSQTFVSTHDIELTQMLNEQFDLYHFSESVIESSIHFDYTLKPGIPKGGNAIRILEINGYPKEVVSEAKNLAAKMKSIA